MSFRSVIRQLTRYVNLCIKLSRDVFFPTYVIEQHQLRSLFCLSPTDIKIDSQYIKLSEIHLAHKADLLGSGFVSIDTSSYQQNKVTNGINWANVVTSKSLACMLSEGYKKISWSTDIVSDYSWSTTTWYKFIRYGHISGVDVKVPWELSRCQHLPQLAICFIHSEQASGTSEYRYVEEVQDQIIDFMHANPPRYGVNWRTSMDVAIRACNWIVAYSLLSSRDVKFKDGFESSFSDALLSHGRHIVNNLEWDPVWRANHYLSNIVGLIFIGAALPDSDETQGWLAFGISQLITEVERQVNPDGSNFEASTSYHRLSVEMIVYATAVVLGLSDERMRQINNVKAVPACFRNIAQTIDISMTSVSGDQGIKTPFPSWYFERLFYSACFTNTVTAPNGNVVLIGDNDSGRFLKLAPVFNNRNIGCFKKEGEHDLSLRENLLDHQHILNAVGGLFGPVNEQFLVDQYSADYCIVSALAKGQQISPPAKEKNSDLFVEELKLPQLENYQMDTLSLIYAGASLREGLTCKVFPDFGLYIYQSSRVFMSIRCGSIGQDGFGGHAHNDQLSITLMIDGEAAIDDPGTFTYTRDTHLRQQYRSVAAHFAPHAKALEPGSLDMGLWRLGNEAKANCLQYDKKCFFGRHQGYRENIYRKIEISENTINITDFWPKEIEFVSLQDQFKRLSSYGTLIPYCPAYGIRCE